MFNHVQGVPSILIIIISSLLLGGAVAAQTNILPADFKGAKQPQIAIDSTDEIFVAFGKENTVFVTSSSDEGKSFSTPQQVATLDKLALGMRRGPKIVAVERALIVSAISHRDGNLYAWRSEDHGKTWSSAVKVNDVANSAREGLHAMAANKNGLVISVWLDLREGGMQLWGARSTNAGKTWTRNVKIYESPDKTICQCCHPSVAIAEDGRVVVMWRNFLDGNRDMFTAHSDDGGQTFGAARPLGTSHWKLNGCPMDGGSTILQSSNVVSVWRREKQIFVTTNHSPEVLVSESGTQPIVTPTKMGLAFFWQSGRSLYRKRDGTHEPELIATDAVYPSVAWSPALRKSFLVWESSSGIFCSPQPE